MRSSQGLIGAAFLNNSGFAGRGRFPDDGHVPTSIMLSIA